jgi:hypothetical protein
LESSVDECVQLFINLIERKYVSTEGDLKPMDFATKSMYFTLDVISTLAFGRRFGHLDHDMDVYKYIHTIEENITAMSVLSTWHELSRLVQSPLFRRFMPLDKEPLGFGKFMALVQQTATMLIARIEANIWYLQNCEGSGS